MLTEVIIDGETYVPKTPSSDLTIVIFQRGWVMIGNLSCNGDDCVLSNARVIRRWGTTNGLGQLAADGPQENTKLDPAGTVRFHILTTIARLDANPEKWA